MFVVFFKSSFDASNLHISRRFLNKRLPNLMRSDILYKSDIIAAVADKYLIKN